MLRASCCSRNVVEGPITSSSGRAALIIRANAAVASATLRAARLRRRVAGAVLDRGGEQEVAHPVGHAGQHVAAAGIVHVGPLAGEAGKVAADEVEVGLHRVHPQRRAAAKRRSSTATSRTRGSSRAR